MKAGYKYGKSECPVCGKFVADNWYIRHLKEKHPVKIRTRILSEVKMGDIIDLQDRPQIERIVVGAIKSAINEHGPITIYNCSSAAKRIVGQLKEYAKQKRENLPVEKLCEQRIIEV